MTPHPYRGALLMAGATIAGLVLLMLTEGWAALPCFALAAVPALRGGLGYWNARR